MEHVTYLMIDLRGYTPFILSNTKQHVKDTLHRYYKLVDDIARKYDGVLCSTLGDAIGVFFAHRGHAERAVLTANEILKEINSRHFPMNASAGIATGWISIDKFKTANMKILSPIGNSVVEAYRLQNLAGRIHVPILVAKRTYNLLPKDMRKKFRSKGKRPLKGFKAPRTSYSIDVGLLG